jgi:hypothetical protein
MKTKKEFQQELIKIRQEIIDGIESHKYEMNMMTIEIFEPIKNIINQTIDKRLK